MCFELMIPDKNLRHIKGSIFACIYTVVSQNILRNMKARRPPIWNLSLLYFGHLLTNFAGSLFKIHSFTQRVLKLNCKEKNPNRWSFAPNRARSEVLEQNSFFYRGHNYSVISEYLKFNKLGLLPNRLVFETGCIEYTFYIPTV